MPLRLLPCVLLPCLFLTACADGTPDHDDPTAGQATLAAAVQVQAFGCHETASVGAGSFIADERILTVAHVVAGSTAVEVVLADGRRATAKVTAIDRRTDLALLDVEVDVTPLPRGRMPRGGSGQFVVYRDGVAQLSSFRTVRYGDIDVPDLDLTGSSMRHGFELSATVLEGDSGSVLVSNGTATAVVFARSATVPGKAWAVDIKEAEYLLAADTDSAVDTGACV